MRFFLFCLGEFFYIGIMRTIGCVSMSVIGITTSTKGSERPMVLFASHHGPWISPRYWGTAQR